MTALILSLALSTTWAMDSCDKLLNIGKEIELARTENRSRLLNGEISEVQFQRVAEELDKKELELGLDASQVKPKHSQVQSGNKTYMPSFALELDFTLSTFPHPLRHIEYDPKTNQSLLILSDYPQDIKPALYMADGNELSSKPVVKAKVPFASFWPWDRNKLLFKRKSQNVFYDYKLNSITDLGGHNPEKTPGYYQISHQGNWMYPEGYNYSFQGLSVRSTRAPYKAIEIDINLNKVDYSKFIMSPREDYLLAHNYDYCVVIVMNDPTYSASILVPTKILEETYVGCSLDESSQTLFMYGESGVLIELAMAELKKRSSNAVDIEAYIESSKPVRIIPHGLGHDHKFSPDGRFLAVTNGVFDKADSSFDYNFVIYDLVDKKYIVKSEVPDVFPNGNMKFNFSRDGRHFVAYSHNQAQIYKIIDVMKEVVK